MVANSVLAPLSRETQQHDTITTGGNEVCQVCGAKPVGLRYGVISCESCKKFFERNAKRRLEQPRSPSYDIKCRLEKCRAVGMQKGSKQSVTKFIAKNGVASSTMARLQQHISGKINLQRPSVIVPRSLNVEQPQCEQNNALQQLALSRRREAFNELCSQIMPQPKAIAHQHHDNQQQPSENCCNKSNQGPKTLLGLVGISCHLQNRRHEELLQQVLLAATDASQLHHSEQLTNISLSLLLKRAIPHDQMISWSIERAVRSYLPFAIKISEIHQIRSLVDLCGLIDNAYALSWNFAKYRRSAHNATSSATSFIGPDHHLMLQMWPEFAADDVIAKHLHKASLKWKPDNDEFHLFLAIVLTISMPTTRISDAFTAHVLNQLHSDLMDVAESYFRVQTNGDDEQSDNKMQRFKQLIDLTLQLRDARLRAVAALYNRRPDLATKLLEPVASVICEHFASAPNLLAITSSDEAIFYNKEVAGKLAQQVLECYSKSL